MQMQGSNLSSKRANAPEPIKNIDLKPSAAQSEATASKNLTVDKQVDVKVITEDTGRLSIEDDKTVENSEKSQNVVIESDKEIPEADEKAQIEPAGIVSKGIKYVTDMVQSLGAQVTQLSEKVDENKEGVPDLTTVADSKKRAYSEITNIKPDAQDEMKNDEQVEEKKMSSGTKKLKVDDLTPSSKKSNSTVEAKLDSKIDVVQTEEVEKIEIKATDDTAQVEIEASKDEVRVEVDAGDKLKVEIEAGKDEPKVEVEAGKDEPKVEAEAGKEEAKVESATKQTEEIMNIRPLFNTQSDVSPSVVKDIPLTKMQEDVLSKNKDDAKDVAVNHTPSLNPEKLNVDETKPASDIETQYMNEMNKISDAPETQEVPQAITQKVTTKPKGEKQPWKA